VRMARRELARCYPLAPESQPARLGMAISSDFGRSSVARRPSTAVSPHRAILEPARMRRPLTILSSMLLGIAPCACSHTSERERDCELVRNVHSPSPRRTWSYEPQPTLRDLRLNDPAVRDAVRAYLQAPPDLQGEWAPASGSDPSVLVHHSDTPRAQLRALCHMQEDR